MSWEMVRLGDLAESVENWNPLQTITVDTFNYIDIGSVNYEIKEITGAKLTECKTAPSRAKQLVKTNDILVSTVRPNLNAVAKVSPQFNKSTASTGFCVIRCNSKILDNSFLFNWVKSSYFINEMISKATGASYPAVSDKIIFNSLIPLPPISEQKRIAAILDKADEIRRKREQAITKLEQLAQSIFVEMFGDPVTNNKGWEITKLGNVGTLDRGISKHRPRNAPELLGGNHPLIQTGDVANCDGYIRTYISTYSDIGLKQSKKWIAGTLCITIAANIAKTGILTFDSCFPDSIVGFSANNIATIEYVRIWLSFLQKTLEDNAPVSAQKNINLAILRELPIPLPPIALQEEFAKRINQIEKLKAYNTTALANHNALFASLQQQAFSGNL
jgi:type I restriction enzyme S subunit